MLIFYQNLCDKSNGTEVCDNVINICILSELTIILADEVKKRQKMLVIFPIPLVVIINSELA